MPDFHQDEQPSSARDYRLSPRKVALWAAVVAVAAVVALIAVAVINDADALNTVALYLAVIAFVAQLIMYVAQNESSARQLKQSQDVQRETSTMLRGIQEANASTQRLLNGQYNVVINALVEAAAAATAAGRLPRADESSEAPAGDDGDALSVLTPEALEGLRAEFAETAAEAVQRYAEQSQFPMFPASGPPSGGIVRSAFGFKPVLPIRYVDDDGLPPTSDRVAMKRAAQRRATAPEPGDRDRNADSDHGRNADDRNLNG
jgi:hypothetical protein